jgi:hypothetical protein
LTDSDLRPREIGHNGHPPAGPARCRAEIFDHLPMAGKIPVGKVEPGNIHSRSDHLLHDLGRIRSRSDRANNFGLMGRKFHADGRSFLIQMKKLLLRHCEPEGRGNLILD